MDVVRPLSLITQLIVALKFESVGNVYAANEQDLSIFYNVPRGLTCQPAITSRNSARFQRAT